jgi:uncharacterized protein with HEPN domain
MMGKDERDLLYVEMMIGYLLDSQECYQTMVQHGLEIDNKYVLGAVCHQLVQVGECLAKGKLSTELQKKFPEIKWSAINGFRNFVIHEYSKVKDKDILYILENSVPETLEQLRNVKEYLKKQVILTENG